MIQRLISLFKPRNVHYYRCTLAYCRVDNKQSYKICDNYFTFQMREKNGVIDISDRYIKQNIAPFLIKKTPKHLLCNGEVKVVDVQYLGAFKAFPTKGDGCRGGDYLRFLPSKETSERIVLAALAIYFSIVLVGVLV